MEVDSPWANELQQCAFSRSVLLFWKVEPERKDEQTHRNIAWLPHTRSPGWDLNPPCSPLPQKGTWTRKPRVWREGKKRRSPQSRPRCPWRAPTPAWETRPTTWDRCERASVFSAFLKASVSRTQASALKIVSDPNAHIVFPYLGGGGEFKNESFPSLLQTY